MSWWTGAALGFDLETDGPVPTEARIITAATVLVTPGNEPQAIEVMLRPERDIPAEASAIHGISTDFADKNGIPRSVGIRQIVETIADLTGPVIPIVGHNVSYDLTLLDREMRRTGQGHLEVVRDDFGSAGQVRIVTAYGLRSEPFPVIDTYVLDKAVDRFRKGKRQLSFVAEYYGVPMAEGAAHGATADVFASLRIAYKIAKRCSMDVWAIADLYGDRRDPRGLARHMAQIGSVDLPRLHELQMEWAAEQAEGLRDYFVKSGNTEAANSVDGRWPVRPMDENQTVSTVDTTVL